MLFFLLLAGIRDANPLNQIYFFQFDTSKISSSLPDPVRWTLYNYCGVSNGRNSNCSSNHPGLGFEPQKVFNTTTGIPTDLIANRDTYYYLTKISFAFYLITTFFSVLSLLLSSIACCSRLGGATAALFNFIALLFVAAASAMITAAYVMARNAFTDSGIDSSIGVKAFAFTWSVVAALLLSFLLLCCTCAIGRRHDAEGFATSSSQGGLKRESSFERAFDTADKPKGRGFFSVNRNRRNEDASAFFTDAQNQPITTHPHTQAQVQTQA